MAGATAFVVGIIETSITKVRVETRADMVLDCQASRNGDNFG